jgi:hypothetical protein
MKLSIVTFSLGREKYLIECAQSVYEDMQTTHYKYEHHIVLQGVFISKKTTDTLTEFGCTIHRNETNLGIGEGINQIIPSCKYDLVMKFDEDCVIRSKNFFYHINFMHKMHPNASFSPFVVGLKDNLGGVKGFIHYFDYNNKIDAYYMRRMVNHIGGIARICPKRFYSNFKFTNDLDPTGAISGSEDGQFSQHCLAKGVEMFYMDTHAIVEHNEGTICQHQRYPEYFKNRK